MYYPQYDIDLNIELCQLINIRALENVARFMCSNVS